jgi:hypothetical protein
MVGEDTALRGVILPIVVVAVFVVFLIFLARSRY